MENNQQISGLVKKILKIKNYSDLEISDIYKESVKESKSFLNYCFEKKLIKDIELVDIIIKNLKFDFFDVNNLEVGEIPRLSLVREDIFYNYCFLPIYYNDKKINIVTSNPLNEELFRYLKTHLNVQNINVFVGNHSDIINKIKLFFEDDYKMSGFDDSELEDLDVELDNVQKENEPSENEVIGQDTPIVKFVNQMLISAIKMNASDLHFEPYEHVYRVRFRIDGVLQEIKTQKPSIKNLISTRLKVMSGMDIAEKRKPQDGRIKLKYERESIDFRVSSCPTLFGEKIVLRILDSKSAKMGIEKLGYEKIQNDLYIEALYKPQGMVLVTGPTGSGKTVSLYAGLNLLNEETRNISTAEDPVEINLQGINQVNINNKADMTFANALRSFLRQDPDIIMVGEIRDLETAEIAIKASQTGHMVMSTLHTNSVAETITRLKNMGVASYNIASSVNLIIAQRLVRRLCPHCKEEIKLDSIALKEMGFNDKDVNENFTVYEANKEGCENCTLGYKGRAGVYEVVKITKPISKLILDGADTLKLNEEFERQGFDSLRRSALLKVKQGVTSLSEVNRVTIE